MKIFKKTLPILLCLTMLISNIVTVKAATNLAFGKTTFASSKYTEDDTYGPQNVTDGNYNNIWSMGSIPLTGARAGYNYVAVDLGEAYMLDSIVAATRRGLDDLNARSGWFAQVANDEYFSDAVTIRAGYNTVEYQGNYTFFCDFEIPYRYVRICSPNYFTVAEIEVYGEKYDPTTMNRKTVFSDTNGEFYQPGAMLLSALGIMSGISKTEFAGERILTRAQAARIMTAFAQLPVQKAEKQVFDDVSVDHWAADYIYTATKAGVISADTEFRPDDFVTDKEFLKLVLYAMGYGEYVELRGGWDKGVYDVSKRFNLTQGANVTKYENLTRGSASMIMFNALNTPLPEEQIFALDGSHHIGQTDKTMLESNFGLTIITGRMKENSTTSLIGAKDNGAGMVRIDDTYYNEPDQIMEFWIGKNVGVAVDVDNKKEIKAAWVDTDKTETITVYDYQRVNAEENYYEYESEGEKNKKLKLAGSEMFLIKNNSAITDWTKDDLICPDGYIEFVDNDTDGVYDVAICFEPTIKVAKFASNASGNVNVVSIDGTKVSGNNLNYLYITKNGKNSTAGRIAENEIVKAYQSPCGKSLWIDVGGESFTATIGSMTEDGVELDGNFVEYTEYYKNHRTETDSLVIGKTMTVLLDNMGRIVWVVKGSSADIAETIGYVIKITNDNMYTEEPLRFKLYSQHGTFSTLDASDRIVVDGRRYKMDELRTRIQNNGFDIEGQFVMYKANKEGKLVWMDTEYTDKESNSIITPLYDSNGVNKKNVANAPGTTGIHNSPNGQGIYSGSRLLQPLKKNTLAFTIPLDTSGNVVEDGYETFYKVSTAENTWPNLVSYTDVTNFYGLDDNHYPSFGVKYSRFPAASTARFIDSTDAKGLIVSKVIRTVDEDNETVWKLCGYDLGTGKEMELLTDGFISSFYETGRMAQNSAFNSWFTENDKFVDPSMVDNTIISGYIHPISQLLKGEIITYQLLNNEVYALERVFSINDVDFSTYDRAVGDYYAFGGGTLTSTLAGAAFKLIYGQAAGVNGDVFKLKNLRELGDNYPLNVPYNSLAVVYVVEDGYVSSYSGSNLPVYVATGNDVVIYTATGNFRAAVIYK